MERTYNMQVDNGLFVAEHYIGKDYKDITMKDLVDNIDILVDRIHSFSIKHTLASNTHNNTALTQGKKTKEQLLTQMQEIIKSEGNEKNCLICGQKKVSLNSIANKMFMEGLPANTFYNYSNNLKVVDVCNECLLLSIISILNTQKISYPFLYIADSDDFMRDTTEDIQNEISKIGLIEFKKEIFNKKFLETMSKMFYTKDIYDDMTYLSMIYFQNGNQNRHEEYIIDKKKILFLLKLKNENLIHEFMEKYLFNKLIENKNLISYSFDKDMELKFSKELLQAIKEEYMTNKEKDIINYMTDILLISDDVSVLIKELKLVNTFQQFQDFVLKKSESQPLYKSIDDFEELTSYKTWRTYKINLIANLLLNQ